LRKKEKRLTRFQERKLEIVAEKMNKRAKELLGLKSGEWFWANVDPGDGLTYAIFPEPFVESVEREVIDAVLREFDSEIQKAIAYENPLRKHASLMVSNMLWQVNGLFEVRNRPPYRTLKNGTLSPIYFDLGVLTSYSGFMNLVAVLMQIESEMTLQDADNIIGGEARGIAFADRVSHMLNLSTGFARKEVKPYGTQKEVEGQVLPGDNVIIIEDMITDGGSKEVFIKNIQQVDGVPIAVIVVFDRKQGGEIFLMQEYGIPLISLTDIYTFIDVGLEEGYLSKKEYDLVMEYLVNPEEWNTKAQKETLAMEEEMSSRQTQAK
jgi:orotate phosphoribosyltransferase